MNLQEKRNYLENLQDELVTLKKLNKFVWYKVNDELKICPEFQLMGPVLADEQIMDFSFYFNAKEYIDINTKISSFYSIYNYLKKCNPKLSEQQLQILFKNHLEQLYNEKRSFR